MTLNVAGSWGDDSVLSNAMADPTPSADAPPTVVPPPVIAASTAALPSPAAPVATSGTAVLAIAAPWYLSAFVSGIEGWDDVTQDGTSGPEASADQVIESAAGCGVTLERRKA